LSQDQTPPPSPREEDLRRLFEAAPVPLALTRQSDSTVLMVNRAAAAAFEFDMAAVVGTKAAVFYARPADREAFILALTRDGRVDRREIELKTATGRPLWASVSASLIEYRGEPVVLLGIADLSDRVESARALRESEERFRALAENAPLGVYRQDLEGHCLYTNPRWSEVTGFSADEARGKGWWRAVHPDDFAGAADGWAEAMAGDGRYRRELRLVRPNGEVRWVSVLAGPVRGADDEIVGHVGSIDDITERRRADESLREEYEFRNSVIQHAAEGLCVCHAVDEYPYVRFTVWNERMTEITGRSLEEINRLGWYQTLYPDPKVQALAQARMARMRVGDNLRAEPWEIARADGQRRIVQITTSLLQSGDGRGHVLALIEDVTEKQHAEMALLESQQMLKLVLDTIPVRLFWKDRNLTYLGCNRLVAADAGLESPAAVVGKTDLDLPWSGQASDFQADDRRVIETGEPKVNYEEAVETADGRVVWARTSKFPLRGPSGEVVGVLGAFEDITDRKEVEEGRRLLAERLSLATQAASIGTWELELPGQALTVDDQFVALYGGGGDQGKADGLWAERVHPEDRARSLERRRDALHGEAPAYDDEFRVIWPDGSLHYLRNLGRLVKDEQGRPSRLVGVTMDVTPFRRAEEDVRRLNAELERRVAERTRELSAANRELESFSYSVSHDLRAPLRAIDGFSQALLEDYGGQMDATASGHLRRVRLASQRMGQLIDDLLDLSRTSRAELRRRKVSLSALAEAIVAQLRTAHPTRLVDVHIAPDLEVEADESLSRVLLENLLGNAWKYTSRKPTARIELGRTLREGAPAFFVKDDGDGFDMAFAHKLFGPFQRLHGADEFEGTGIGLATVQRIVQRHGGWVLGEGEPGRGATFYFSLAERLEPR
jgi:PAS domain S-box-containing protein